MPPAAATGGILETVDGDALETNSGWLFMRLMYRFPDSASVA